MARAPCAFGAASRDDDESVMVGRNPCGASPNRKTDLANDFLRRLDQALNYQE